MMPLTEIRGIEAQERPLPVLVLADTSGSMNVAGKISSLNQALATFVQDLQSNPKTAQSVLLSVITFDSNVRVPLRMQPVADVKLESLIAPKDGLTHMGEAFRVCLQEIGRDKVPARCLAPILVLVSDGQPNDPWPVPLQELIESERGRQTLRLALAIGKDADVAMLKEFVTAEYDVMHAHEAGKIGSFFKFVSYVATQVHQTQGRNRGGVEPDSDLLT